MSAAIGCHNHIFFDKLRFCQLQVLIEKGSYKPGQLSSPITPTFASSFFLAGVLNDSRLMTEALRLATGPMIEYLISPQWISILAGSIKCGAKS